MQSSPQCIGHAVQAFLRGAITPSTKMLHADVDVLVSRVPCVCSDSLPLLISSTDTAETQSEAAGYRARARAAAWRVVGIAQAALFSLVRSTPPVVLRGSAVLVAALDVLAVLHDACVDQNGRILVRGGHVQCQYHAWARWTPQWSA